jgi:hypothetical protein
MRESNRSFLPQAMLEAMPSLHSSSKTPIWESSISVLVRDVERGSLISKV